MEARELLRTAQVSPKAVTALFMALSSATSLIEYFSHGTGILSTFLNIFFSFFTSVLAAGFALYCMTVRRGERAEIATLFDGFNMVGKIILLNVVMGVFIGLWALLFLIPGIVAMYRYQFALYNLLENPGIGVMEAIDMSKRQTMGYKVQLFKLDLSYLGWLLLAGLPAAVVLTLLFFYPNRVCVELGYFETAKRTSGVGLDAGGGQEPRPEDGGWNGL